VAVAHDLGEPAGAEGQADVVEQVAGAALADAELLADGAARAVGGDEVVRADGDVLTGLTALRHGGDAVGVGLERHQFGGEPQVAAEPPRVVEQHRLQVVLAAQAPGAGAEAGQSAARVDVAEQPLARVADQGGGLQDAVVVGEGGRRFLDGPLDAGHPEQLHRADVVPAAPGMDGGAGVPLHQQVRHSEPAQEQRGRQADQGPADDEDRDPEGTGAGRFVSFVQHSRLQRVDSADPAGYGGDPHACPVELTALQASPACAEASAGPRGRCRWDGTARNAEHRARLG
jgi:hypothetical protein